MATGDEVAFFDVETTVPTRTGQGFAILEFGSILVCPKKLVELESYSTLVKPIDLSLISSLSVRCNGITREAVTSAPAFAEIADKVYDLLHGRIWAGHNILKFDCPRIREAFSAINRPAPEPKGTIDTLPLLRQRFGKRAGDMKMATLATYFDLGKQTHRSLDDVRMNLEVVKHCATVLFLESSLPDIFTENSWVSPNATTRSRTNGKTSIEGMCLSADTPSSSVKMESHVMSTAESHIDGIHPILSFVTESRHQDLPDADETNSSRPNPFDMRLLGNEMELQSDDMEQESGLDSRESSTSTTTESSIGCPDFLEPNEILIPSISVILAPFYRGTQKIQILHNNGELQVCCRRLKVRFGISTKFLDYAGRPRLNFVVDASSNLCRILDAIDNLAQKLSVDSGSSSEWRPVVTRKPGYVNCPTVRLHLQTVVDGNVSRWVTEIYQKESSATQKLVFSRFDRTELDSLITPGTHMDAYFSVDSYDYQQNAGLRLVAQKLVLHST